MAAGINPQATAAEPLLDILDKRYSVAGTTRYKKGAGKDSERGTLRNHCNTKPLPYHGTCAGTGAADSIKTARDTNYRRRRKMPGMG